MNQMVNNTARVKLINVELVKETLKFLGEGTKQNIVEKTGLSVATCGNILRELVLTGEVTETEFAQPNGGRPARKYQYCADFGHLVCLYLNTGREHDSITYAVTNLLGEVKEEKRIEFSFIDDKIIEQTIGGLINQYPNVRSAAIGIPGVVRNGIIGVCDISKLEDFPIVQALEKSLSITVTAENDMNSTVYGFYKQGHYEEDKTVVAICFLKENYPGAGIIVDGHIIRGNSNFAGEVSFLDYGVPKLQLLELLNNQEKFIILAVKSIVSMIAVMNPAAIVLTGNLFHQSQRKEIEDACMEFIPKEHMPELFIRESMEEDYRNGLIAIALENLSCGVQLVKRRI